MRGVGPQDAQGAEGMGGTCRRCHVLLSMPSCTQGMCTWLCVFEGDSASLR